MKKYLFTAVACLFHLLAIAQLPQDYVIPLKINTDASIPSIQIEWPANADAATYTIKRKIVTDTSYLSFFLPIATIDNTTTIQTTYTDTHVEQGVLYEYEISGSFSTTLPTARSTYICAGIDIPATHKRGSIILLCDSSIMDSIATGITQLYKDLVGDGWKVIRINVDRTNLPANVKQKIITAYNEHPDCKQVLIIGHVPVPYSGNIMPDGHSNHNGCWSADGYYGSLRANWTDTGRSNSAVTTREENINLPFDGKFDLNHLPGVQLAVGRVDLSALTSFTESEATLLNNYLKKNHRFRHHDIEVQKRALIEDNFLSYTEKFSQSAWKSYAALVGYDNVQTGNYETALLNDSGYLWSYGAGAGTYNGAGGIGTTATFNANRYYSIFTQLFGSYFGDWDSENNFMKASLASAGNILTCAWGGRPHWFFHHMSAGLPIGYSALLTMNNDSLYKNKGLSNKLVHIGLMGDPSLRNSYPRPAKNLSATVNETMIELHWDRLFETDEKYYIYRANAIENDFTLLNTSAQEETSFTDYNPLEGNNVYMVRRAKMDTVITEGAYTNNTTYENLAEGIFYSVSTTKVYRFMGNGNWDNSNNWLNNNIPPAVLLNNSEIIISPAAGGNCILNVPQTISPGAKITVENNQHFIIAGKLTIQ